MARKLLWVVAAALVAAITACGDGQQLTADSSCRDYMSASAQKRETAVNKLAMDLNASKAAGLGQPNVDNACEQQPDATLGTVISRYREPDQAPRISPSDDGVADLSLSDALHLLRTSQGILPPEGETSGYQLVSTDLGNGTTVRDSANALMAFALHNGHILPDGVTLDMFSQLLDKALITVTPSGQYYTMPSCHLCHQRVVHPDYVMHYEAWVVTFPPEGVSRMEYFHKLQAELKGR